MDQQPTKIPPLTTLGIILLFVIFLAAIFLTVRDGSGMEDEPVPAPNLGKATP